jgi:HD-GYP domain-containing protein (c-di-GMP phosphodiesterase class II)
MRVHPKQLVTNCVITEDVYSKGLQPIIPKNTVVTPLIQEVLDRFMIEEVEVDDYLEDGMTYFPLPFETVEEQQEHVAFTPFLEHYRTVVEQYENLYQLWQSGVPLDIHKVRETIIPLAKRMDQHQRDVLLLFREVTKDRYLAHHSVATALISSLLAKQSGHDKDWIQVCLAGFLADSGMSKISQRLLKKPQALIPPEHDEIRKHPIYSYRYVEKCASLSRQAKLGIIQHHEKLDGSGYPMGVKRDKIHPYAKMIAISDSYHAMMSERYYQKEKPLFDTMIEMRENIDHQFDDQYLYQFFHLVEEALKNQQVRLSTGEKAEIIELHLNKDPEAIVRVHGTNDIYTLTQDGSPTITAFI